MPDRPSITCICTFWAAAQWAGRPDEREYLLTLLGAHGVGLVQRSLTSRLRGKRHVGRRHGRPNGVAAPAEIELARLRMADHLRRCAMNEHLAFDNDVAAVGDLQRLADLVIGDQNRDTAGL